MKKSFDEKIYDYVNEMLTGVQPNAIKSMLRVRLMGILGTYFKQKEELEKCKQKLEEMGVKNERSAV